MNEFRNAVVQAGIVSSVRMCRLVDEFAAAGVATLPVMLDALRYNDAQVRGCAARALGRIEDGRSEVVSALMAALEDEQLIVRQSAAAALGVVGPLSLSAVTALQHALSDEDHHVREFAEMALDSYAQGQHSIARAS